MLILPNLTLKNQEHCTFIGNANAGVNATIEGKRYGEIGGELDKTGGHPAAGVYRIDKILDQHHLSIYPTPPADGINTSYSIGRINYYRFSVSNCDFFVLDTRGNRELQDIRNPRKKGLSMLGERQKTWLMEGMRQSDADFFFVVSSVNFAIPHGYYDDLTQYSNKDESWTAFLDEREQLIDLWEKIGKPVFIISGDIHNSMVIKITDTIWNFASSPHNTTKHNNSIQGIVLPLVILNGWVEK